MEQRNLAWAPPAQLLHEWNKRLSDEHLSVREGDDRHLVYIECFPNTLDNIASVSKHPREFVVLGRAGSSSHDLFRLQVLRTLSKRELVFLQHYQDKSVPDIAAIYGITEDAVHSRIRRIRKKLRRMASTLERRIYGTKAR